MTLADVSSKEILIVKLPVGILSLPRFRTHNDMIAKSLLPADHGK